MNYEKNYYTAWSTRKRRDGKWIGTLSYKTEDGRYLKKTRTLAATGKRAADTECAAWFAEMNEEAARPRRDPNQTVGEYMAVYIEGCAVHAEPSTVSGYEYTLRRLIAPYDIASIRLDDLGPSDVRAWLAELLESYGATTISKAFVLLRSAMRQAVNDGRLARNPTDGVKAPKRPAPQPNALAEPQRVKLARTLAEAAQTPDVVGIQIALYTGLREGEICALRWRNVDLAARAITVCESIGKAGGRLYLKVPKTQAGRRTVYFPGQLAKALSARRVAMMEECMKAGIPFDPAMFVIGYIDRTENGDYRFFHPHVLWEKWRAVADLLNLVGTQGKRVTFHDLRHTYATTALAEGADVKSLADQLGHANAAVTLNVYADADPDAKRRVAERLGDAMTRGADRFDGEVLHFRPAANS